VTSSRERIVHLVSMLPISMVKESIEESDVLHGNIKINTAIDFGGQCLNLQSLM